MVPLVARHPFSQDAKNQANTTFDLGDCQTLLNSATWSGSHVAAIDWNFRCTTLQCIRPFLLTPSPPLLCTCASLSMEVERLLPVRCVQSRLEEDAKGLQYHSVYSAKTKATRNEGRFDVACRANFKLLKAKPAKLKQHGFSSCFFSSLHPLVFLYRVIGVIVSTIPLYTIIA